MDWNSKTPLVWDWEIENGSLYSSADASFSSSYLGYGSSSKSPISASADSSMKEGVNSLGTVDGLHKDCFQKEELAGVDKIAKFSTLGASVNSSEPMMGLKLGKRTYFEDVCVAGTTKTTRRCTQTTRCQVEGCNLDLKSAKDYHRRHRICENHSKSPRVIVAGLERRFCQQCSRFHDLSEFDDKKRSCRRRLLDHNARRRRPQLEATHFNSNGLSSSLYDGRQQVNLLLNGVPTPISYSTWRNECNINFTQSRDSLCRPEKTAGVDRQPQSSSYERPSSSSMPQLDSDRILSFQSTKPFVLNHDLAPTAVTSNLDVAPDLRHALSLLSTNSRRSNEPQPTSLEQFMHVDQSNVALALSQHTRVEEPPAMVRLHSMDSHNNGSGHFQEFQLFKAPYESGFFYPNQIN